MKKIFLIITLFFVFWDAYAQRQVENLDRGIVAIKSGNQVYIGWRLLGNDPADIAFNVYSDKKKLNKTPITASTNYIDVNTAGKNYSIKIVIGGKEQKTFETAQISDQPYISIPLNIPTGGKTPAGEDYTYRANDASVGDLDGDGEYEIILKWDA